ncbi:MAG TPA: hypothetical protein VGK73_22450 [Polyangiaceae bacterium]
MATCEVCEALGRPGSGRAKRVLVGERLVALCASHARVASSLPVAGVEELRRVFRESGGKRSLVERRQALDRRVFPARPEGRRRNGGRRASDRVA